MKQPIDYVNSLNLLPHPEGGYYRETGRNAQKITLPDGRIRNLSTTIFYLLQNEDISHFHRLSSEETWFFHEGQTIELLMLINGKAEIFYLGTNLDSGEIPQLIIPINTWFAAHLPSKKGYALVSCTVSPGFEFEDFELASLPLLQKEGYEPNNIPPKFVLQDNHIK